jgi:hypothetical protein
MFCSAVADVIILGCDWRHAILALQWEHSTASCASAPICEAVPG